MLVVFKMCALIPPLLTLNLALKSRGLSQSCLKLFLEQVFFQEPIYLNFQVRKVIVVTEITFLHFR